MKIAVVFDTPYAGWEHADHVRQMETELATWDEPEMEYQVAGALQKKGHEVFLVGVHDDVQPMIDRLAEHKPDLVFNAAEGFHGDAALDHLFPTLLEAEEHRYTGTGPLGLHVTRNKEMSKKILAYHGIRVPGFVSYPRGKSAKQAPELTFPVIVKPVSTDASAGIAQASVVYDLDELAERVQFIHDKFEQAAMAEEFMVGRELYVGVVGNDARLEVLPITEMVFDKTKLKPEERIATKSAKWDDSYRERKGIKNVFARPISRAAMATIEETCATACRALALIDYARLDIRLTDDDQVCVIEANANPFLSRGHEMATAAEKVGMDYPDFIQRIVDEATKRYARS